MRGRVCNDEGKLASFHGSIRGGKNGQADTESTPGTVR